MQPLGVSFLALTRHPLWVWFGGRGFFKFLAFPSPDEALAQTLGVLGCNGDLLTFLHVKSLIGEEF